MRLALRNGLLAVLALVALSAGYFASRWYFGPPPEEAAPALVDFSLPDLAGKTRWLSEWQGKILVLNFWATWCEPCREEIPLLVKLQKRYQSEGVQIVGVAIDNGEAVAKFAKELRISYPLLLAEESGLSLMARYGNPRGSLPYTLIIARDGTVTLRKLGAMKEKQLAEALASLVNSDATATLPQ